MLYGVSRCLGTGLPYGLPYTDQRRLAAAVVTGLQSSEQMPRPVCRTIWTNRWRPLRSAVWGVIRPFSTEQVGGPVYSTYTAPYSSVSGQHTTGAICACIRRLTAYAVDVPVCSGLCRAIYAAVQRSCSVCNMVGHTACQILPGKSLDTSHIPRHMESCAWTQSEVRGESAIR